MKKLIRTILVFVISLIVFTALYCTSVHFYIALLCGILTATALTVGDYLFLKNNKLYILLLLVFFVSVTLPPFIESQDIKKFILDCIKYSIIGYISVIVSYLLHRPIIL